MRYYVGFRVGHTYCWDRGTNESKGSSSGDEKGEGGQEEEPDIALEGNNETGSVNSMDCGSEKGTEWEDVDAAEDDTREESDDEEFHARYEMYHGR